MEKRIREKLHSSEGFTIAETLLSVLILLMCSSIVAMGVPVAKSAYEKVVLVSNAEVLLSTAISTLRNELGTAQEVEIMRAQSGEAENTVIAYYSSEREILSRIYVAENEDANKQKMIMLERYYRELDEDDEELDEGYNKAVPLISIIASVENLYLTYDSVSYENGIIKFKELAVRSTSGNRTESLASTDFSVRVISYNGD